MDQPARRTHVPSIGLLSAAVLAVGLAVAGMAAGHGLVESRTADRFVTVKGVAERDVEADLAFWSIGITVPAATIGGAQAEIEGAVSQVHAFLAEHGIPADAVSRDGVQVTDRATQYSGPEGGQPRFVVTQTLLVRTNDVAAIHAASQAVGRLIQAGVPLANSSGYGQIRPTYVFTGLNDVKPAMIAEATASAREAAEQFAQDSGSEVAGIRRANQGVFVIQARDQGPGIDEAGQRFKTVRVVTTVEYYLEG